MNEDIVTQAGGAAQQVQETEVVIEYIDNDRRRLVLAVIIGILVLLLAVLGYVLFRSARPLGRPDAASLPEGVTWVRSIYNYGPQADQMLNAPIDAAVAPDGTIWVTTNVNLIVGYRPNGDVSKVIALPDSHAVGVTFEGIAVGEDGNIYVCDYGRNAILVYSPSGQIVNQWNVQLPREIAVRNGRVAVAAASGIALFDADGDLISQWGQRGSGEDDFNLPHGIALGDDGKVYVSDTHNRRVRAYTPEGRLLWTQGSTKPNGLAPGSQTDTKTVDGVDQGMQLPLGMTFDAAGRLVVADAFEFQLLALDPERKGQVTGRFGAFGQTDGKFGYPTGVSYDPSRDWYVVADTANDRVQIIRLSGSGGNAARAALARVTDGSLWLCSIPLLLLVLAIIVGMRRRRSQKGIEDPRG